MDFGIVIIVLSILIPAIIFSSLGETGLLTVLFSLLICGLLIGPMFLALRKAKDEINLTPYFQQLCSGDAFGLRTNVPCFRLAVYKDFIVVSFLKPYVFKFAEITEIKMEKDIFGKSLYIRTKNGKEFDLCRINNPMDIINYIKNT